MALDQNYHGGRTGEGQLDLLDFNSANAPRVAEIRPCIEAFRKTGPSINAAYFISRLVEASFAADRLEEVWSDPGALRLIGDLVTDTTRRSYTASKGSWYGARPEPTRRAVLLGAPSPSPARAQGPSNCERR